MCKVILATLTDTRGDAVATNDLGHEIASKSPSPASNTKIAADTGNHSDARAPDESVQGVDFAARLRAAFQGKSMQALISREDAMGAAAEIEQLWAALWIVVDRANDAPWPRGESWSPKLGQADKWKFCLRAARMQPIRRDLAESNQRPAA
jgi:hypothetical protein